MNKHKVHYKQKYNPEQWDDLYGENLRPYAYRNFKGFVCILYHLFVIKNKQFDALIGSGDSGSAMASLTCRVLDRLGLEKPSLVRIPIQRFKDPDMLEAGNHDDYFDNSVLLSQVKEQTGSEALENILYVDDETSSIGFTAKTTYEILTNAQNGENISNFTMIAEDNQDGLEWRLEDSESTRIDFYSTAQGIEGLYSVLFYVLPWEIEAQINECLNEGVNAKRLVAVLLDAPLREKGQITPKFSNDLHLQVSDKVKNLEDLRQQFLHHVDSLIDQAVADYKNKDIVIQSEEQEG